MAAIRGCVKKLLWVHGDCSGRIYDPAAVEGQANRDPSEQLSAFALWPDTDDRAARLKRDGEMSLNVIPVLVEGGRRRFLDADKPLCEWDEWKLAEQLSLQSVPVPHSWKNVLPNHEEGLYYLPMTPTADGAWRGEHNKAVFFYSRTCGW